VTIRKGEAWGTIGPLPPDAVRVRSDAELGDLVTRHRQAGAAVPPVALLGGDLMRAVGGTGSLDRLAGDVALLPTDVVRVDADGRTGWFVAHLVARRSWWRGELFGAVNGQYVGQWDVAARAHPNDGRVDVVRIDAGMRVRDRWRARTRAVTGAHVPHPAIEIRQHRDLTVEFARPVTVWLDGRRWATARRLELTVEADALVVCV
jgi:hypothetical protein